MSKLEDLHCIAQEEEQYNEYLDYCLEVEAEHEMICSGYSILNDDAEAAHAEACEANEEYLRSMNPQLEMPF